MKTCNLRRASVSGLALIHLLLTPCLAQPGPPILDLRFENTDAASGPAPYVATAEGVVTGDVHGRLVTRVLERVPISPSEISVKAQMLVYDSSEADAAPLLVTEVEGNLVADQNSILSGTVLRGWLAGKSVVVVLSAGDFDLATPDLRRGRIYTWSWNPPAVYGMNCRKWVTAWPRMAGVVELSVDGNLVNGTFAGEVIEATPSADGKRLHLVALYDITAGTRTFTAQVEGDQDNDTGRSVLIGKVTSGWYSGAHVRAEYQLTTCDGHDPCWVGYIRLAAMPATIKPSTALQHTAVHLNRSSSFSVTATGVPPMTYQWRRDGVDLPGRTNRTLTISSAHRRMKATTPWRSATSAEPWSVPRRGWLWCRRRPSTSNATSPTPPGCASPT